MVRDSVKHFAALLYFSCTTFYASVSRGSSVITHDKIKTSLDIVSIIWWCIIQSPEPMSREEQLEQC